MRNTSKTAQLDGEVSRLKTLLIEVGKLRSLRDPMAAACAAMELTKPQVHALLWLGLGPVTMGDLARHLGITEKTATGVVDRLEREGWARRDRSAADRRVISVSATKQGRSLARRLDALVSERLGFFLGLLDKASRKALFVVLERLLERLPSLLS